MYPQQIQAFLRQFFQENHCELVSEYQHQMTVQLTIDMDKRLMNRPFYWQYIESTNEVPSPAQLSLIIDKNKVGNGVQGEIIHFGSPRLSQLIQVANDLGSFVRVYEKTTKNHDVKTILTPWLGVNYKVAYTTDRTKEMLYSLGINLMTGSIFDEFQESLNELELEIEPNENTFSLPYTIPPARALQRLDSAIDRVVLQDDHQWAEEAKARWQTEQEVLDYFYRDTKEKPASYDLEKQAMEELFKPKIQINVINGGLFYLQ